MTENETPTARGVEKNGQLCLEDPVAVAIVGAVDCMNLLNANRERLPHFVQRYIDKGRPDGVCLLVLDVDDPVGGQLADVFCPGMDWQAIRDRGEHPVARGLAETAPLAELVAQLRPGADKELLEHHRGAIAVLVISGGTCMISRELLPSAP